MCRRMSKKASMPGVETGQTGHGEPHHLDPPSFRREPLEVWSGRVKPSDFACRKPLSWLGGERVTHRQMGRQEAQATT